MYENPEALDVLFGPMTDTASLPAPIRDELKADAERILANVYEFEAAAQRVAHDSDLTSAGKDRAVQRLLETHLPPIVAAEREIAQVREQLEATRERALAGFTTMSTNPSARPRDAVHYLEEREIRERQFDRITRGEIFALYLAAIQTGTNPALVAAVQRSPVPVFAPPLAESEIEIIEAAGIARSPLRETLFVLKTRLGVMEWVVGRARQRLGAAADPTLSLARQA